MSRRTNSLVGMVLGGVMFAPSVSQAHETNGSVEVSAEMPSGGETESDDVIPVPDYAGARAIRPKNEIGDRFRRKPYLQRYKPEAHLVEIGMYSGVFLPSSDHSLFIEELPRDEYLGIAGSIGGRFAYFPATFFGAEIEGFGAGGQVEGSGFSAIFYTVRGHLVGQLPFWSIVPFFLVGGGALGAASESMGHDRDPAAHFGVGVKIPTSRTVSSRIDFRDTLAQKFDAGNGVLTHYPEMHIGVHFTLNRTEPPPARDQDYDGLSDTIDECPQQGALTINGCPAEREPEPVESQEPEAAPETPEPEAEALPAPVAETKCSDDSDSDEGGCSEGTTAEGDSTEEGESDGSAEGGSESSEAPSSAAED